MVIQKTGKVAYTLQLPASSKIHPTCHVSQLKKHYGPLNNLPDISIPSHEPSQPKTPWKLTTKEL